MLRDLVLGTLRNVVHALNDALNSWRHGDRDACQRLADAARGAWERARSFVECKELELFNFDSDAGPWLRQYADW